MTEPRDITGLSPEQRALLMLRMRRKAALEGEPAAATIPHVPRDGNLPLSFAQQRLWFLDRWAPESPAYNVPAAVRMQGDLDVGAFAQALTTIVHRHETLRTTFPTFPAFPATGGEPRQVIAPPAPLPVPLVDLTALPLGVRGEEAGRLTRLEARRPFDLGRGPLLRVRLLRLDRREHVALVNTHHIISDGWSVGVLIHELSELYSALVEGRPPVLPPLPVQYADFAVWQRRRLRGEELERQLAYWRERLGDAPPPLELPTDRPRPAVRTFRGGVRDFDFPDDLWPAIEALCQRQGTTPFMVLAASFMALLHRLTGQTDLALGTPIAGRNRQEVEGLIGCFVNTLVLRAGLVGDPAFAALLARVREETLGAFSHQDLPFEKLVEELQPERRPDAAPLFQASFSLENTPEGRSGLPGLEMQPLPAETGAARFDLGLNVIELPHARGHWEYAAELFDAPTLDRMSGHFFTLLAAAAADPALRLSALPLLSAAERHQLLIGWNDTEAAYERELTIHELFEAQAAARPDAVAVVAGDEQLTYAGLARESRRLARHLRGLGVGPDAVVGVSSERSLRLPVAMLAILRAGGAYLPVDPSYPEARQALMLEEAGVRVVVDGDAPLPGRAPGEAGERTGVRPDNVAYVLYTSGSTGRPKGVAVPHRGVLRLTRGGGFVRLDPREVVLQVAPASFDASTFEVWGTLLNGGRLVMMPPGRPTLDSLADALVRYGVTTCFLTAGLFHAMVDERLDALAGLRQLVAGGDVVSQVHARRAMETLPGCDLWSGYGPTEVTTFTSCHPLRRGHLERSVPIGRPIADTRVYVVDAGLSPVPLGVVGELVAGGAGLARGYFGRPDLTAERFVPDPCGGRPGERLYRTGDLVRYLPDGTLEFLGRADQQVKLRGFRVEPQEVEAALLEHPAVAQAAVLVRGESDSLRRLVAYVQVNAESGVETDLRDWLRERLPEFMVPSAVVAVPEMPLTPNGKVDRRALLTLAARPAAAVPREEETSFVSLRGPVEEVLGGIWTEILGRERAGARDGFFDLGGHSLLAIRLLARVRQAFGVELPVRALFENPALADFARQIEQALDGPPPSPPIVPVPRDRPLPLSFAQQRLWFIDQLEPGSAVYNTPFFLRLTGALEVPALAAAFAGAVERHEVLRTTFAATAGSSAVQVIGPPFAPGLPVVDLVGLPLETRDAEARRQAALEAGRPFDLLRGPVLRTSLLRLAAGEHVLLLNAHHIATDAWSMEVLWREVSALYEAARLGRSPSPTSLPALPVQYADFTVWQREWLQGEVLESQLGYWRRRLGDDPAVVELPADRPRPAVQSHRGAELPLALSPAASAALRDLARREGATPFMVLLSLFVALLGRLTGQRDLPVGTPVSGRRQPELEGLVGFFLNTLVIRAELPEGISFRELTRSVRTLALEAYAHQDVPFEKLVDELSPRRRLSHSPLFQVLFVLLHPALPGEVGAAGLAANPFPVERGTSKFDLFLALYAGEEAFTGAIEYATDLYDAPTVARFAAHLRNLATALAATPEAPDGELAGLSLLAPAERHQLLAEWNDTAHPLPELPLHHLFERQAERTPDAAAATFGDHSLTYAELARRASRLAGHLRRLGIGPESLVGLGLDRSLEMVTGVLGVLTAGAAYVPLDPALPRERRAYMLESSGAGVLLTRSGLLAEMSVEGVRSVCLDGPIPERAGPSPRGPVADPACLAYVIYTSGSTGRPKGVGLPRLALSNLVDWQLRHFLSGVRTLQLASLSFDVSFLEMFACWGSGGTLLLVSEELRRDVPALARFLVEAGAEKAIFPVVVLQRLAEEYAERGFLPLPPLAEVITMGEQLQTTRAMGELFRHLGGCAFHNHYGPSESHVVTAFALAADPAEWATHPPIGRPIANARVHLLDAQLSPVPPGVPGELVIGGVGGVCLARGYAGRPDLTAERFVPDPFGGEAGEPGGRLYRTGDKVRRLPDGNLDFLGRFDHQVKVRGFRVEPEEIESVLGSFPGVRQTVVLAREVALGDTRLVAYVVAEPGAGAPAGWRSFLREKLPEHMVPSSFVELDALPLNANGKVDRRTLPAPPAEAARPDLAAAYAAPRTPIEEALAAIWSDVLGVERVGVNDDFFELGGQSLLATQAISRVRQAVGVEVPLRALFEGPTVAELARAVEAGRGVAGPEAPPLVRMPAAARAGDLPLSFAQQRLWFLDRLVPDNPFYNMLSAVRLAGPLDVPALREACREIARRHEVLRTTFPAVAGRPVQAIAPEPPPGFPVIDLEALPPAARSDELERLAAEEGRRPFDLACGPVFRAALLRLSGSEHSLFFNVHHIASDGWSLGILYRDLAALYGACRRRERSPLPDLPVQYADFAVWQHGWLQGESLRARLEYWRHRLAGMPEVLELPYDRPRPAVESFRGGGITFPLAAPLVRRLSLLARRAGATPSMAALAGFKALLSRLSGREDVPVGVAIAGRNRRETEDLIGFFVNTLVLRTTVGGEGGFAGLVARVRETSLGAYAHQDLPFEKLVEELAPDRDLGRNPLVQVTFGFHNFPRREVETGGLVLIPSAEAAVDTGTAKFDLSLHLFEVEDALHGSLEYNLDLFDEPTARRFAGHLATLLAAAVDDPATPTALLPLLSEAERHQLLIGWNDTARPYERDLTVHEVFALQVAERPDAVAVVAGDEQLTYTGLAREAGRLAGHLRVQGVGPEEIVGIRAERSALLPAAMLGILQAGAAYLPLGPEAPEERLALIRQEAGVRVVVPPPLGGWAVGSGGGQEGGSSPASLANVIYTSGSTGRPKGVAIPHRGILRLVRQAGYARLDAGETLLQVAPASFDASTFEIWGALLNGGRLVMMPPEKPTLDGIGEAVARYGVTTLHLTAGLFHAMVEERLGALAGLRQLLTGGDVLSAPHVRRASAGLPGCAVLACYGPTEGTTFTSVHPAVLEGAGHLETSVPLGRPIGNTRVLVLDRSSMPVPVGVAGDLAVGGDGLARGYLGRPDLTAERFVPDPCPGGEPGERLYLTGDRVRHLADGTLEFLGRLDSQVKVRGFRVEPVEVEARLAEHPAVRASAVLAHAEEGDKRLVAYVVLDREIEPAELRAFLSIYLPGYMLPAVFVPLDALPLTPNGKLDRQALSRLGAGAGLSRTGAGQHIAPRTPTEERLAAIWADLLQMPRARAGIGAEDDFFQLGGHSLLATQAMSRVRDAFGVELLLRALFEAPTVAGLAAVIDAARQADPGLALPPVLRVPRDRPLPLSFAQQRLWFLDRLVPDNPFYNMFSAGRLAGLVDVAALRHACREVARRHEVLRTTFAEEAGRPLQVIAPGPAEMLPLIDLAGLPEAARRTELERLALEEGRRPFDLRRGPVFRNALVRLAGAEHSLFLNIHHIAADGWSMGILHRELAALYTASPLPEPPVQYADFAVWQRGWLTGEALRIRLDYWRRQLAGMPEVLELPYDRPRPAIESFRGGAETFTLGEPLVRRLASLAGRRGATLSMVALAGFKALLARLSGEDDVAVGMAIANRNRREIEDLIGFFVNTLVLRTGSEAAAGFDDLVGRVRETALGAYAHQDLPFERLVEELAPQRDLGRNPLVQVMFGFHNVPRREIEAGGLVLETPAEEAVDTGTSRFDLALHLFEAEEGLQGMFEYSADLFDAITVRRFAGQLATLLAAAVAEPEVPPALLPLLSEAEVHQLLLGWNDTAAAYERDLTVHEVFALQAAERPDTVAVVAMDEDNEQVTYLELARRARRLARHLRALGVGPEEIVGLHAERSAALPAAMLGILEAGAAYLPLDPEAPEERLALMREEAGVRVVLNPSFGPQGEVVPPPLGGWAVGSGGGQEGGSSSSLAYLMYTSGSTGRPKGVAIPHRGIVRLVRQAGYARLDAGETLLQVAPASFDASTFEIWGALLNGGRLVMMPPEKPTLDSIGDAVARHGVTTLHLTAGLFHAMVEERLPALVGLRQLLTGGDVLSAPHIRRAAEGLPGCAVLACYGPTEGTTFTSVHHAVLEGAGHLETSVPLGRPIGNTRALVLDRHLLPVPRGVAGELAAGGDGLARGYLARPDVTAERFVPDPWGLGERLYLTGDRVRHLADGTLELLGRFDTQVKIRGFRVEPGEIEARLDEHPAVRASAVVAYQRAHQEGDLDRRLVACVVLDREIETAELRAFLAARLPDFMLPGTFVPLASLPLTPNGKVDRKALARLAAPLARTAGGFVAPRTPTEERLAAIWVDLLQVPDAGAEDDFFALGGHSLLATQVVSRVRDAFGVELPLRALFETPTVSGLAALIDRAGEGEAVPPIRPVPRDRPLPLSYAQERLWFLDRFGSRAGAYNESSAFRLTGRLDVAALRWAMDEIVRRHETLRTTFGEIDGLPVQQIAPTGALDLPVVDLSGLATDVLTETRRLATGLALRPFDLARGPLLRGLLVRLGEGDHAVLLALHHVISDGWSIGVFVRELSALYTARLAGEPSPLPPLAVQYADFAVWQRDWLRGEVLARQIGYWRQALAGLAPLELPTDRPRPATLGTRGGVAAFSLGEELTRAVRDLGRRRGATLFMVLLAAFQGLLQLYTGEDDVAVGTPIAGRNRGEIEGLIGFFVNMLVLRGDLSGDPGFRALVDRAKETALGAFAHQDVPFEKVVEELQPERDLGRNPLFQVGFQVENAPAASLDLPGLQIAPAPRADPAAKVDLNVSFTEGDEEITGVLEYDADLFDRATVLRLGAHLRRLLASALAAPERPLVTLSLLTPEEEHQLLAEWNDAAAEAGPSFLECFESWARRTPEATALVFEDEQLTYGELARRADELAATLAALGVGPEVLVGLCLEASVPILVAILAVWKAGGAYLPLDPSYPQDRLAFMLEDSGAALVLTEERLRPHLPERYGVWVLCLDEPSPLGPLPPFSGRRGDDLDALAYVIYTSGSTGRPKGVAVTHRGLGNLAQVHAGRFGIGPGGRVLQVASFSFDASVAKFVGALGTGAALVQARRESWLPGPDLAEALARTEVSFSVMVPSLLSALPLQPLPALSFLATAGEACPAELVERWASGRRFWNLYGPTEMSVICLGGEAEPTGKPPGQPPGQPPDMGLPLPNCRAHVADRQLRAVPVGVPGELLLQGAGLARGYLGRPELTAERFVPDPWAAVWGEAGARLYRTGDLVRRRADGRLDFLGRTDQQVKIRGFRIELGEIEAVLLEQPGVSAAAVTVREGSAGDRRLAAFVVSRGTPDSDRLVQELLDWLQRRLPDHMVPSAVTLLDHLPLNPNGKVDRKALDRIVVAAGQRAPEVAPPRTPVEQVLAGIWSEVLGIERVGAGDDFFALSGNSLLAAQVASRVHQTLGVELPLRRLFERATLTELAREIEAARASGSDAVPLPPLRPAARQPRGRPLPASFYQEFGWQLQGGPAGALLNMPLALRARGPLDLGALLASLAEIVRRHEGLRSVFVETAEGLFLAPGPASRVPLPVIDLAALPKASREELLRRLVAEDAVRPFDLSRAPGFRVQVVRLGGCDHALLVTMHHVISDGASMTVFQRELWALLDAFSRGLPSPLPELAVQPGDFAWWQRRLATAAIAAQVEWWKRRLAGRPPALLLPGDRPRPQVVGPNAVTDYALLPAELVRGIRSLARAGGCTVGMVLTAAVQVLLFRYTGEVDVIVGSTFAGRTRQEITRLIGLFLNTLPVRSDLSGAPAFRELLLQVRDVVLDAYAHQDVPFPRLAAELYPGQPADRRRLFGVRLNVLDFDFVGAAPAGNGPAGLTVEPMERTKVWARYDLALELEGGDDFLLCYLTAAADLLSQQGLADLKTDLVALLEQAVADPEAPIDRLLPEPCYRPLHQP